MSISLESQQLRDALISAAFLLKWSAADLRKTAYGMEEHGNPNEAQALLEIVNNYEQSEASLLGFADEVRDGRVVRNKAE